MTKYEVQNMFQANQNDVTKTIEACVNIGKINEIKKIFSHISDGQIIEALRLRFYDVERATQALITISSSNSSFDQKPAPTFSEFPSSVF